MWKSVKMYLASFGPWLYVFLASEAASAIGLAEQLEFTQQVPRWAWWTILIVGLILGPFLAFHRLRLDYGQKIADANARADAAEAKLKVRDCKIRLGQFLTEGRHLCDQTLTDVDEIPGWLKECNRWFDQVIGHLRSEWPEKVAFFEEYDKTAYSFSGSINEKHNNARLQINGYCRNLKEMLGD